MFRDSISRWHKNSRILEFWDWKLQDPGILRSKTPGSWSLRKMLREKWRLHIVTSTVYKNKVRSWNRHSLLPPKRYHSKKYGIFSLIRDDISSWNKNSRILEFWNQKLQDPGVLRSKSPRSWSFWKMLHEKFYLHVATSIKNKNKVRDRNKHVLFPPKRWHRKNDGIFSLLRDSISN